MSAGIRCMGGEGGCRKIHYAVCTYYVCVIHVCVSVCLIERDSSNTTNSHV